MNFHFITPVWGEAYIDLYLNIVLPTQLSPGNLLAFRNEPGAIYKIHTTTEGAEAIVSSSVYLVLSQVMEIQIKVFNYSKEIYESCKYKLMNYCHQHAVIEANQTDSVLIILTADAIFSDGAFSTLKQKAYEGKQALMIMGISVVKETFVPLFVEQYISQQEPTVKVSCQELVKLSLEHIHPVMKRFFWDSPEYHGCAANVYWSVKDQGFIARCFHLHPLMIKPMIKTVLPLNTIDFYYLEKACPSIDDIYVVEDSDEIVVFEISSLHEKDWHYNSDGLTIEKIVGWAKDNTTFLHREFSKHKIRMHSQYIHQKDWENVEKETDEIFRQVYQLLDS